MVRQNLHDCRAAAETDHAARFDQCANLRADPTLFGQIDHDFGVKRQFFALLWQ